MLLFITDLPVRIPSKSHSNTSHVIVYPEQAGQGETLARQFKYISCYCLSWNKQEQIISLLIFKYISCYCLSLSKKTVKYYLLNSNTSHVIVYLDGQFISDSAYLFKYISCYCLSLRAHYRRLLR